METVPQEAQHAESGQPQSEAEIYRPDLRRDRVTHRCWLAFGRRPSQDVIDGLKARGWKWSGRRGQWHNPLRFPEFPPNVVPDDQGSCNYNSERADMLQERAEKRESEAAVRVGAARRAVEGIPFGQPILVGHHSERHHRGAVEKHERNMRAGLALAGEAEHLRSAAEGSRARQEKHGDPVRARRKVEDLRKLLARPHLREDVRAEYEREFAEAEQVAAQEIPADALEPKPGDLAVVKSWLVLILKVNEKTLEYMLLNRGPRGSTLPYARNLLKKIISSGHPLPKYEGSCMTGSGASLGLSYCGHQHDTKLQASKCARKTWPGSKKHHRGTRMAEPLPIPREALVLLGEAQD